MSRRPARAEDGLAWITGASSGIGEALALELARRGWRVAATARSGEALQRLSDRTQGAVIAAPADVADLDQMKAAARTIRERAGPIGLLVANAGVYAPVDARQFASDPFARCFGVNVLGAAHALEAALPEMVARRAGHVHLVSSATGFGGMPTAAAYGASKAALINLAECLKIELDPCGVGVSLSTPGFVATPAQAETPFPKPFMISPENAARRIADGLRRGGFETSFPRRFTWLLKTLYALPRPLRLPLIRTYTGWGKPI